MGYQHMKGRVARALGRIYDKQPMEAARQLAQELHYSARIPGPPFTPREFARALQIPVKYGRIQADGVLTNKDFAQSVFRGGQTQMDFTSMSEGGPTIVLREPSSNQSKSAKLRENFTLAHEIGHYVIRDAISAVVDSRQLPSDDQDEEFLCNVFAAELLMPTSLVAAELSVDSLVPECMVMMSRRYEVSIEAMVCRISSLFRGQVVGIIWINVQGWPTVHWSSPRRFSHALLCTTGSTTVERAFGSAKTEAGRDDLLLGGERMRWLSASKLLPGEKSVLTIMHRCLPSLRAYVSVGQAATSRSLAQRASLPVQQLLPLFD